MDTTMQSKYNNRKVRCWGETFDSMLECERYKYLKALEQQKVISNLQRQVKYVLLPSQKDSKTRKTIERENYIPCRFRLRERLSDDCGRCQRITNGCLQDKAKADALFSRNPNQRSYKGDENLGSLENNESISKEQLMFEKCKGDVKIPTFDALKAQARLKKSVFNRFQSIMSAYNLTGINFYKFLGRGYPAISYDAGHHIRTQSYTVISSLY